MKGKLPLEEAKTCWDSFTVAKWAPLKPSSPTQIQGTRKKTKIGQWNSNGFCFNKCIM